MIVQINSNSPGGRPEPPESSLPTSPEQSAAQLGESVRAARRKLGLDQTEVALIANVSARTVHAVERGKPTMRLDVLLRILEAVGMKLSTEPGAKVWTPGSRRPR